MSNKLLDNCLRAYLVLFNRLNISKGGFTFAMAAQVTRLLATLMALQAGLPLLDFSGITGKAKQAYFFAVQASLTRDYEPMKAVFNAVLKKLKEAFSVWLF